MLFWNSKDESAWGLALVGFLVVVFAAILGNVAGDVQPKAPVGNSHPDVSSPYLHQQVSPPELNPEASPYPSTKTPAK